eukprot:TRINITY_DN7963_c0_g1_i1.p1 TRINITY_DN7963_c0_g1~~TRINITY_DN7963_c0_g1_i1.p1  ORF type:complete len:163 (-),score=1.57 TRINITY_DN7963_c0_g1_i1:306-794(-)
MMQFSAFLTLAVLLVTTTVQASPMLERRQTITPPARYYLQTTVVNGDHEDFGSNKSALYLYSHHTGAGLGDAGLSSNISWAMEAYLNGTQQLFTYEGNQIGPWPLAIGYGPYQQWNLPRLVLRHFHHLSSNFSSIHQGCNSMAAWEDGSHVTGGMVFLSSST